ncbi:MAG: hypothetical protein P8Y45_21770 [Exilibacterium sp.]
MTGIPTTKAEAMNQPPKINKSDEEASMNTIFFTDGEFEGRPVRVSRANYLAFLSMRGEEVPQEVHKLRSLFDEYSSEEIERDLVILLTAVNWRVHNIACVFIALGFHSERVLDALWARIREGSWVFPQLVATAAFADPDFEKKAKEFLTRKSIYYKSIVALGEVLKSQYGVKFWLGKKWFNIRAAKKYDRDNSGAIALGWSESLRSAIA